jgi:hypothetical protein
MTTPTTALLLVGSAKPAGESTSEALGSYLLARLAAHDIAATTWHVARALRTPARVAELLTAVDRADLFILAFPLYVDGLPYLATAALEQIAAHRQAQTPPRPATFLAIANCGFPEAHHNVTALAICAQFAETAGFQWAGGLALGAGGVIHGQPLTKAGGLVRNVTAALDQAAGALAAGEPLPQQVVTGMAQPLMPGLAYMLMGDIGWLMQARQHHALTRLGAKPLAHRRTARRA